MAFSYLELQPSESLMVKLPTGDYVEIDTRDLTAICISHLDSDGDHVDGLEVTPAPDLEPHPSLSAAERNPNLR
jgi:hypothetical protein